MIRKMALYSSALLLSFSVSFSAVSVAAIKSLAGGKDVRFVWTTYAPASSAHTDFDYYSTSFNSTMWVLDTREGTQRQLSPGGVSTAANYTDPLFVSGGNQIVYSIAKTNKTYVINFDGTGNKLICTGQVASQANINGVQWIYYQKRVQDTVFRRDINDTSKVEVVFSKGTYDNSIGLLGGGSGITACQTWFHVSPDGKRAAITGRWEIPNMSGYKSGIALLPCLGAAGKDTIFAEGCWNAMSPDNSKHTWVFQGNHTSVDMYDSTFKKLGNISFSSPTNGESFSAHKFSQNDANFVTIAGPGIPQGAGAYTKNGGQIWFGKLNTSTWLSTTGWAVVTATAEPNFFNDSWVGTLGNTSVISNPKNTHSSTLLNNGDISNVSVYSLAGVYCGKGVLTVNGVAMKGNSKIVAKGTYVAKITLKNGQNNFMRINDFGKFSDLNNYVCKQH